MKTVAFSLLALAGFTLLFSCKNDAKTNEETQTVVTDSIPSETAPDAMYVTAVSGLTLREFPNLQSTKLAVMPLGTKVKIVNAEGKTTMNVGGIDGAMDEVEFNNQKGFAFPNPKGSNSETQQNNNKKKGDFVSELLIARNDNQLQKIVYNYKTTGFGYTVTITKEAEGMKLEKTEVAD